MTERKLYEEEKEESRNIHDIEESQKKYLPKSPYMIEMPLTTMPSLEELRIVHEARLQYLLNWKKK